ncbi:unnamed protein product [Paramecium octaurelia]|uniref:Uncharacterized protein n=1 Tax=Paramecium octaurelia TaxID=43137 RepID=A0A8S1X3V1_PAROT|nr:unnamed protein product [Paramecium octaurelia]
MFFFIKNQILGVLSLTQSTSTSFKLLNNTQNQTFFMQSFFVENFILEFQNHFLFK